MGRADLKLSLTTKMTLAVTVLVTGLFSAVSLLAFSCFAGHFKETIQAQQLSLTTVMADHLAGKVAELHGTLMKIAAAMPKEFLSSPERLERFLDAEQDARLRFDDGMIVADRSGRIVAERPPVFDRLAPAPALADCIGRVLATGRPAISAPYRSRTSRPVITFAVPVADADGTAVAVLAGSQDLLSSGGIGSIAPTRFGRTGYLYLLNNDRTLVVHPDRSRILQQMPAGVNRGADRAVAGFQGVMENTNSRGIPGITVFRRVGNTGWILASHFPVQEAYESLDAARRYVVVALAFMVAAATGIIWLLMRRLTAPLKTMIRHLEGLPEKTGEDRYIGLASSDEIGVMADTFNRMVRELDGRKEELQVNADLYRIITEFSSEMAIWETPEGAVRYVSPNCVDITGHADSEFRADPSLFDRIVFSDDRTLWQRHVAGKHWERGERSPVDLRIVTKDGRIRWVGHTCHEILGVNGEYLGVRSSYRDITERMEVEDVLRKLSLAVEQNPCAIVITDTAGFIEYVNPRFCEMTGYSLGEAVGRHTRVLKSGAHDDDLYHQMWETISGGGEWRGEFQNRTKDGKTYWVFASISPIRNSAGEITHYIAIKEEITARKQAETALRKSKAELLVKHEQLLILYAQVEMGKQQWEQTLDCIMDGVLLVDKDGAVVRCNKAVSELAGVPLKEIRGRRWKELLMEQQVDLSRFDGENGELFDADAQRWLLVRSYPFTGGGEDGRVVTLHDTTAIKEAGAELEQAYHELKATQARILQQEKMASIGQLAAGVAHEINNPIGFVSSNLSTLGKYLGRVTDYLAYQSGQVADRGLTELDDSLAARRKELKLDFVLEDARQLIRESLDGTDRVRQIVQNLKSFSRVDEAEFKFAQINDCLESTLNIVWNELKYKATVNREYGDLPPTKCYPQQLNQVFMNLLVNAAHAIEKQGEITVASWAADGFVHVAVRDTGCGIPSDNLTHIFEPFFTTKEVGKGTGLGLSISYDIVKKHNGEILVDSMVGEGTSFTVRIPVTGQ